MPSPTLRELSNDPTRYIPHGGGRTIMLDPGMWENAGHLRDYSHILNGAGFDCFIGNLLNVGMVELNLLNMRARERRHQRTGGLTVVGHSLGGLEAQNFAARYPGVDHVFKVGTPRMPLLEEDPGEGVTVHHIYGKHDMIAPKPPALHKDGDPRVLEVDADHMSLLKNPQCIIFIGRNAALPGKNI